MHDNDAKAFRELLEQSAVRQVELSARLDDLTAKLDEALAHNKALTADNKALTALIELAPEVKA